MTESAFLDAIAHPDYLFTVDAAAARTFPAALALATPEDRVFLDELATTSTRYETLRPVCRAALVRNVRR
ncbi:hypothetical protein [Nocardia sp. NPDC049707]|uniref:hypothetical protein n=1 Tax=Nocardia sp. NPDC049707 TaxID=3154735 RepID=UPI003433E834